MLIHLGRAVQSNGRNHGFASRTLLPDPGSRYLRWLLPELVLVVAPRPEGVEPPARVVGVAPNPGGEPLGRSGAVCRPEDRW